MPALCCKAPHLRSGFVTFPFVVHISYVVRVSIFSCIAFIECCGRTADVLRVPSPPASPSLLTLLALAPEIAEHFAEVERLGCASYWHGEIGRADSGIEQATAALEQVRAVKELAVHQYTIELGKVYADSSRASSHGWSASKGKGRARPE